MYVRRPALDNAAHASERGQPVNRERVDQPRCQGKATLEDTDVVIQSAQFDGLGRRIKKTVTNSGDLDGVTVYLYQGHQIIETRDGSGP